MSRDCFARSRSAGLSLVLGTQELADLTKPDPALQSQVLANVHTIIAHRQNVPASAELIANVAGAKAAWVTTEQTDEAWLGYGRTGRGSRRRGYEFRIHPSRIKQLATGQAAVITPGDGAWPVLARMHHPAEALNASDRRGPGATEPPAERIASQATRQGLGWLRTRAPLIAATKARAQVRRRRARQGGSQA